MGVAERKTRERKALREEILDAARQIFVTEGYDGVSMRRVAEKIEYSPTTIYLYFKDKSDLMYEICQETFAKLRRSLEAIQQEGGDPLSQLRRGLRAYVDFGLKHPQHYIATFIMPHERPNEKDLARHHASDSEGMKAFGFLRAGVQAAVDANQIQGDVDTITRGLWATIYGITSLLIVQPDFPWGDRNKVIDFTIDSLLAGLGGRQ